MHGKECILHVINSTVEIGLTFICTSKKKKKFHEIKNGEGESPKCDLYCAVSISSHAEPVKTKHLAVAVARNAS